MTLLSAIVSLTPTLDDYVYAVDADLGGSPTEQADGRTTFTAIRNLLQANLTTATITVAAANTSALVSTGYSLTGSDTTPMINLSGTWNTTGIATLFYFDVTDTASSFFSNVLDLKLSGTSILKIRKDGVAAIGGSGASLTLGTAITTSSADVRIGSTGRYGFNNSPAVTTGGIDTAIYRDEASIIAQRLGTSAQAFRVYSTWTNSSNGSWMTLDAGKTTANVNRIISNANGTGTIRPIAISGYDKSGGPSATELPAGTWGVFRDTSGGSPATVVLAYNDAGSIRTVELT
jgi:hypothetical protein